MDDCIDANLTKPSVCQWCAVFGEGYQNLILKMLLRCKSEAILFQEIRVSFFKVTLHLWSYWGLKNHQLGEERVFLSLTLQVAEIKANPKLLEGKEAEEGRKKGKGSQK